jgi:hypothetical protein
MKENELFHLRMGTKSHVYLHSNLTKDNLQQDAMTGLVSVLYRFDIMAMGNLFFSN